MHLEQVEYDILKEYDTEKHISSVFTTYEWLSFLKINQKGTPIVLKLLEGNETVAVFVGMIIKKFGIKILGSPFEGWLTPDMGFIEIKEFDYKKAVDCVSEYAFKSLKCHLVQIIDKNITEFKPKGLVHVKHAKLLYKNLGVADEDLLSSFTRNGRRDVRASERKGLQFLSVPFNKDFADKYYDQLVEVFAKQGISPHYNRQKIYDMIEAFGENSQKVLALEAIDENGVCVGTVVSLGHGSWAYYLGAASKKSGQKMLPNEGLFWNMIKFWNKKSIAKLDLVGERDYKLKYNPKIINIPVICVEKYPGIVFLKYSAKSMVKIIRKIKGKKG